MNFMAAQLGERFSEAIIRILLDFEVEAVIVDMFDKNSKSDERHIMDKALPRLYDLVMKEQMVCSDPECSDHKKVCEQHMDEQYLDCNHWNVGLANHASCFV